ncbi:MAG: hypothetical protein E6R08_00845 [Nevskiaceae bacterium]|nr:MAG: hypothetical protein E6R08_00845 [Nevskiaceae bacterium]
MITAPSSGVYDVPVPSSSVERSAATGSGESLAHYLERRQADFARFLAEAPPDVRTFIEADLFQFDYEPAVKRSESLPSECSLTGIDENCCPCGKHL